MLELKVRGSESKTEEVRRRKWKERELSWRGLNVRDRGKWKKEEDKGGEGKRESRRTMAVWKRDDAAARVAFVAVVVIVAAVVSTPSPLVPPSFFFSARLCQT